MGESVSRAREILSGSPINKPEARQAIEDKFEHNRSESVNVSPELLPTQ